MKKRQLTLLLLSAGRRVELMECFRRDAELLGLALRVLAVDAEPGLSAACARADVAFRAPLCNQPEYDPYLIELCGREGVDLVVPTIDTELLPLARMSESLALQGARAVISQEAVVALARDKLRTAEALAAAGISTPRTVALDEFDPDGRNWTWPVVVKPRGGSSSKDVRTVARNEFHQLHLSADFIVQERLKGPEYTVNMYFAADGGLKAAIPHLRIETRGGEVSKAETVRNETLERLALDLGAVLTGAQGPLCFQAMQQVEGGMAVFEINARFGGGFPIAHRAGAPFTKWLLEESAGLSSTARNDWQSGVRMLRYDAAVFR